MSVLPDHWTKQSKQEVVFMKLAFAKVYGTVAWEFLFQAMDKSKFHHNDSTSLLGC
jgi:hypothetical protein